MWGFLVWIFEQCVHFIYMLHKELLSAEDFKISLFKIFQCLGNCWVGEGLFFLKLFFFFVFNYKDEEDSFVMKAIIHAINDDNVPGLQHLLGSLTNYDVNQPNKVECGSVMRWVAD